MELMRTDLISRMHKPEEIVVRLRQVGVLTTPGQTLADPVRPVSVIEVFDLEAHTLMAGMAEVS